MKHRSTGPGVPFSHLRFSPRAGPFAQPCSRHVSSTPSAPPPKSRLALRLAVVSVAAAGVGAYIRWRQESGPTTLNPLTFTKYTLIAKDPVSSSGSIFTLQPPRPDENPAVYEDAWRAGVWSVLFKQPQLQIGRDYTPLPVVSGATASTATTSPAGDDVLRFFIRRDPFGEVSRYLHGLELGSVVEMRGPKVEWRVPKQTREVLFIAGGTGIAPALQTGHALLRRTDAVQKPRIHILWANRRREDCAGGLNDGTAKPQGGRWSWSWIPGLVKSPAVASQVQHSASSQAQSLVVRELEALKSQYPGQVTVDYFVDEEDSFIKKQDILDFANSTGVFGGRLKSKMILVSGPDGFISYMAGPKLWAQGMEVQGPLRGIIGELDLKDWGIWKL